MAGSARQLAHGDILVKINCFAFTANNILTLPPGTCSITGNCLRRFATMRRGGEWVSSLGLYDNCITYDAIQQIDASVPTAIVDMSGNNRLLGQLHTLLGDTKTVNVRSLVY